MQTNASEILKLSDVAQYVKCRREPSYLTSENYVSVENLLQNKKGKKSAGNIPSEGSVIEFLKDDILVGNIRPYLKKIWFSNIDGGTNGDVLVIRSKDPKLLLPKYLYYVLSSDRFFDFMNSNSKGAKMPRGDKEKIMSYVLSVPSIEKQTEIIRILDVFNDLEAELEAELEARKKQYEFYRDQLLSFAPPKRNIE